MSAMASQITSVSIVCLIICSSKKASKLRVTGLCEENPPVTVMIYHSPHNGQSRGKCFHLMTSSWITSMTEIWVSFQLLVFGCRLSFYSMQAWFLEALWNFTISWFQSTFILYYPEMIISQHTEGCSRRLDCFSKCVTSKISFSNILRQSRRHAPHTMSHSHTNPARIKQIPRLS